jgi:hypothetical protein
MHKESENDTVSTSRTINNLRKTCLSRVLSSYKDVDAEAVTDKLMEMHGLNVDRFDFLATVDQIVDKGTRINVISIDDNANKSGRHVGAAIQEAIAPVRKAIGFDYYYRKTKEMFGEEEAKRLFGKILDYSLPLSDENSLLVPYCWALNASTYVVSGKDFGTYQSPPPESVGEYVAGISEIVHELSANLAGALAIGTFFFDIAHLLLYKEKVDLRELRSSNWLRKSLISEYKQFIRSVNNVSRNGIESPFTNVSLFDRQKTGRMLDEMEWYFPTDGLPISKPESIENQTEISAYYRDFLIEYVICLQDIYLDVFDKGDPLRSGAPLTFPVTTLNIAKSEDDTNKIIDLAFLKAICNREIFRYNIFASKGSKIASCCFRGDQSITAAVNNDELIFDGYSLETLYKLTYEKDANGKEVCKRTIKVPSEGRFVDAKVVKVEYLKPFISITLEDGYRLVTTDYHKNAYVVSEDFYADITSDEVVPGIVMFTDKTSVNPSGLKVMDVNRNVPNMQRVAYCLEIVDKDATHFNLPNGVVTHNCRLINDTELMDLASQANSFGAGGSSSLGSDRVITNNTLLAVAMANTKNEFYRLVAENMEDSAKLLKAHKELIKDLEKVGTQPFITAGWINPDRLFGTFGIIGTWETAELYRMKFGTTDHQPEDVEAHLLRFINTQMEIVCKKYGIVGNIEQIPGESMAHRLCKSIKLVAPSCEYMKDKNIISNQLIPLWEEDYNIWDRLDNYGKHDKLITGGGILHLTIGEKVTAAQAEKLIKYAVKAQAEHLSLNPTFCVCKNNHCNIGEYEICPECGAQIVSHITRVIGYFRPTENWSPARQKYDAPLRHKYGKQDF